MIEERNRSLRVFLCHASQDKPVARQLYHFLIQNGIAAWIDEERLLPGQDWKIEIPKALRDSDAIVVCLSRNSTTKEGYIQKEIRFALEIAEEKPQGEIFVIPVRLEECPVPDSLSRWHWVDLFTSTGFQKLLESLRMRADRLGMPSSVTTVLSPSGDTWAGMKFHKVSRGSFFMGNDMGDEQAERPRHLLEIPYDYWIGQFPVTNFSFDSFVKNTSFKTYSQQIGLGYVWNGYQFTEVPGANWANPLGPQSNINDKWEHPVVQLNWYDTVWFCQWLNHQYGSTLPDGFIFRLPTEAEWEKAARGKHGNLWPWGNVFDPSLCNSSEGGPNRTTPVGAYSPQDNSAYGISDLAGNVKEWTVSLWGEDARTPAFKYPYNRKDGRESVTTDQRILRVLRGGSFCFQGMLARTTMRFRALPYLCSNDTGFRVVIAPKGL